MRKTERTIAIPELGIIVERRVHHQSITWNDISTIQPEGWRLLIGLRDPRWGNDPYTFARQFVMPWCGVTNEQARRGGGRVSCPKCDDRRRQFQYSLRRKGRDEYSEDCSGRCRVYRPNRKVLAHV